MSKMLKTDFQSKNYSVQDYSLHGIERELNKIVQEFKQKLRDWIHLCDNVGKEADYNYGLHSYVVQALESFHAWGKVVLPPKLDKIREERVKDIKQYIGAFPWHKPITDPYIRRQFFLASKECFEMELEAARKQIDQIFQRSLNLAKSKGLNI